MFEWLPEFALTESECDAIDSSNAVMLMRKAAQAVYVTDKYAKRGEFGELFLHIALRQVFGTLPAISKIFYKDSSNDTVKGFDCVHVRDSTSSLQLWLGEAKFYKSISSAISDACTSIRAHLKADYLRSEFTAIVNKIDTNWPHANRLKTMLDRDRSLDEIFDEICIPVLLTYDSDVVQKFSEVSSEYKREFEQEVRRYHEQFATKDRGKPIQTHLFLLPLQTKQLLIRTLHEQLQKWREL